MIKLHKAFYRGAPFDRRFILDIPAYYRSLLSFRRELVHVHVLDTSRLPTSTKYGAEAKPGGHIEVERGEAVNLLFCAWSHRKLIVISSLN